MKKIYNYISLGIAMSLIYNSIIFKIYNKINNIDNKIIILIVASCIIGPIIEEIIFRKLLLKKLLIKYGERKAILIEVIIFSILHLNITEAIYAFIIGIVLSNIYLKENKLIYPIIIHSFGNLFSLIIYKYNILTVILSILLLEINVKISINN